MGAEIYPTLADLATTPNNSTTAMDRLIRNQNHTGRNVMIANDLATTDPPTANDSANKKAPQHPMTGKKVGAPIGNGNAVRHGLTVGRLPKGAAYIARITAEFRGALERAVMAKTGGEITLTDAAAIQTAIRWERHALLAQRWLRHEAGELSPDQRLSFSRDVARASAERDKCIKLLELDRRATDDWPTLTVTATPSDPGESMDSDESTYTASKNGDCASNSVQGDQDKANSESCVTGEISNPESISQK